MVGRTTLNELRAAGWQIDGYYESQTCRENLTKLTNLTQKHSRYSAIEYIGIPALFIGSYFLRERFPTLVPMICTIGTRYVSKLKYKRFEQHFEAVSKLTQPHFYLTQIRTNVVSQMQELTQADTTSLPDRVTKLFKRWQALEPLCSSLQKVLPESDIKIIKACQHSVLTNLVTLLPSNTPANITACFEKVFGPTESIQTLLEKYQIAFVAADNYC